MILVLDPTMPDQAFIKHLTQLVESPIPRPIGDETFARFREILSENLTALDFDGWDMAPEFYDMSRRDHIVDGLYLLDWP